MAKKVIKKDDVAKKDLFDNVTLGAKEAKAQIELLTQAMKILQENAKLVKKSMPKSAPDSTKKMKDFDTQAKKANQTAQAKLNIDKKILQEKKKLQLLNAQQNKEIKTTIQATQRLTKSQQKNLGTLQKLEHHNTKLRATRAKLNLETKRGVRVLGQINSKLDANNAKIRASGDAMKKQRLNVGNYGSAVGKLKGALGQLGLAFGVFSLIKNSFNVIKDFEQSQADLASVLGVNVEEMSLLTEQAKELGATTTFTASQVAELQKELAKLGFDQTEIEGMTEGILLLAEATGSELGRAAEVTGATMRGFGLEAEDTQKVVDVMAKSFSSSSLDMEKFANSMAKVAPVAKLAGFSIEETTALIGTLTDRGVDASSAGTGLRNMFLLAGKAGLTLDEALVQIDGATDKTAKSFELFGQKGATLGVILAENRDATGQLTEKLLNADGAAKKMAETQRDTLGGAISLLQSAWEGLILKMDEAGGVGDMLKKGIQFLANNLETIVGVIALAVKGWLAYKTIVGITTVQNKIMATSFVRLGKSQGAARGALAGMSKGIKNVGKALKANAIGIAITAIVWALSKMNAMYKEANRASIRYGEIQAEIGEIHSKATEDIATEQAELTLLVAEIKLHNAGSEERGRLLTEMNEKYGTHLQNITDETEATKLLDEAQQKIIDNMVVQIRLQAKKDEFTLIIKNLQIEEEKLFELQKAHKDIIDKSSDDNIRRSIKENVRRGRMAKEAINFSIEKQRQLILEGGSTLEVIKQEKIVNKLKADRIKLEASLLDKLKKANATKKVVVTETPEEKAAREKAEKDAKKGKGDFVDLVRATEDAEIAIIEDAEKKKRDARQISFDRLVADTRAKKTRRSDFNAWLIAQEDLLTKDLKKIEDDAETKRQDARNKSLQALQDAQIIEQKIKIEGLKEGSAEYVEEKEKLDLLLINQLQTNSEIALENDNLEKGERLKIIANTQLAIDQILIDASERRKALRESQFKEQQKEWNTEAEKYRLSLLQNQNLTNEEVDKLMNEYEIKQLEKRIAFIKENYPEMTDEILKMETQLAEKKRVILDKENKGLDDAEKEKIELAKKAIDLTTQMFVDSIDKKISKLDEEIQAHRDLADALKESAREGNITAQESLAEENRLIREAEAEKAEQEKRKQQILMVSAFIKTYLSAIDSGDDPQDALTQALTSQALLDGVVANIGSFFDGTEDTGTVGNPLDSNGGRIALLHNNERVMTAKQNNMIGNVTNDEVARVMEQKRLGQLVDGNQVAVGWENMLLIEQLSRVGNKLDMVNKTIENKPETNIELGAITSKTMEIIESRKKGGFKTVSTFKVQSK